MRQAGQVGPGPRRRAASVTSAVAVLGLLGFSAASAASPAQATRLASVAAPSCRTGVLVPAPSPGAYIAFLGVAALSSRDVWAVGYSDSGEGVVRYRPLIEHWNGSAWRLVASPHPEPDIVLYAVAAISPTDVWAAGSRAKTQVALKSPLIEHWNGSAWSVVASPGVPGFLSALAVASPQDIWAVGLRTVDNGKRPAHTLAEHWDGTRWQVVATPDPSKYGDTLGGVTVAGNDDVWALGQAGANRFDTAPLAEHWDGHTWSPVPIPAENFNSGLGSVTSAGPDDVWSVGWYEVETTEGTKEFTLAEHWNGHRWSLDFPPSPTGDDSLKAVTAVSADDMWAVGDTAYNRTFVLRWNGEGWQSLPSLAMRRNVNTLSSVSAAAATDIWAAGGGYHTLVEHLCPSGQ